MAELNGVVLQASGADPGLPLTALHGAVNLLRETGDVPVEIVVQSGAVLGLVDGHPAAAKLLDELAQHPTVKVLACRNALHGNGVAEESLAEAVGVVPAGIAWLVQRQAEGWPYVRVG